VRFLVVQAGVVCELDVGWTGTETDVQVEIAVIEKLEVHPHAEEAKAEDPGGAWRNSAGGAHGESSEHYCLSQGLQIYPWMKWFP
jgi:hypothetical protein